VLPVLTILTILDAVAGFKDEYKKVKTLLDYLLLITFIWLLILTLKGIAMNFQYYLSFNNLFELFLPITLTILFSPFLYFLALAMNYETFFVNINLRIKDKPRLAKFMKQKVFFLCFLNLNKLNTFTQEKTKDIFWVKNKKDVLQIISDYQKSKSFPRMRIAH